jgi:hypothetical protein
LHEQLVLSKAIDQYVETPGEKNIFMAENPDRIMEVIEDYMTAEEGEDGEDNDDEERKVQIDETGYKAKLIFGS